MEKRKGSKPTLPPAGTSVRSQVTMEVMSTERKTGKNVVSPPGPDPGLPVRLQSVTGLPDLSSSMLASKLRDGFRFPKSPIEAHHGFACIFLPVPS